MTNATYYTDSRHDRIVAIHYDPDVIEGRRYQAMVEFVGRAERMVPDWRLPGSTLRRWFGLEVSA